MRALPLFAPLLLMALAGCAQHYRGAVVDVRNRPVPYARVEGHGMHHALIIGEGPFVRSTVADSTGHFDLVSADWPNQITATSPDSKTSGRIFLGLTQPPYVITIR
jgi:hypothetical protein